MRISLRWTSEAYHEFRRQSRYAGHDDDHQDDAGVIGACGDIENLDGDDEGDDGDDEIDDGDADFDAELYLPPSLSGGGPFLPAFPAVGGPLVSWRGSQREGNLLTPYVRPPQRERDETAGRGPGSMAD